MYPSPRWLRFDTAVFYYDYRDKQTQGQKNLPPFGNLPFLGNLFKHTQVSTQNQELIFFITPRIIQT